MKYQVTKGQLDVIHRILDKENRVEIIPIKDRLRIIEIKRKEIKPTEE